MTGGWFASTENRWQANDPMGGSNSRALQPVALFGYSNYVKGPVLQKSTEEGENDRIKYAASSMQGWRPYMEDARAVIPDLDDNTSFFGVYDGHGGAEVALLCARLFHTELCNHPDYQNNFTSAMKRVFFRMDELLLQSDEWKELIKPRGWIHSLKTGVCANHWPFTQTTPYVAPQDTGSTACIVVVRGNQIMVGNVGDSRCVISVKGQAIQVTTDHKPNKVTERARIQRAGGKVTRDRIPVRTRGQLEYQLGAYRINGMLAVSRVIGDFALKQNKDLSPEEQMATCNPDLFSININNDMEFLVIASDGIWDCMTSTAVVNFVRKYLRMGITNLSLICERLVDRALPSTDNATAILVQFKRNAASLPPLSDSDGAARQGEAAAAAADSRNKCTLAPLNEDDEEEQDDDDATPPAAAEKEEEHQDDEAGPSETDPLLGAGSSEITEE